MGSVGASEQTATRSLVIDNMNEKQLDNEIALQERIIARSDKAMQKYGGQSAYNKAMNEAFPLGAGGDGWTQARINERNRNIEVDVKRAKAYTTAYEAKQSAETRLKNLTEAKKQVAGTGKTLSQLREERVKEAVKNTVSTLKWSTTQKGGFTKDGGYMPRVIKAGNMEIRGSEGLYTIYKDGKELGRTDKLSKAKAFAERKK